MNIATLEDLLVEELKDLYGAETQLVKAFAKDGSGSDFESPEARLSETLKRNGTPC